MHSFAVITSRPIAQATRSVHTQCRYALARQRVAGLRSSSEPSRRRDQQEPATPYTSARQYRRQFHQYPQRPSVLSCQANAERGILLPRRGLKTVQQAQDRGRLGPFSMLSAAIFVTAGAGLYFYFRYEKERVERLRIAEATKGVGKPKVGGPFELVDQDGKPWQSSEIMDGKYCLVYFGFSHCPDICPEELDKMASMLDEVNETIPPSKGNPDLLPIFITCDPARDSPDVLKTYLREFHPKIIGLTGTWEQIKAVCKLYRVYFSTPPGVKPGQDYLVDHSIYFYLMDPEGDFVEAIGRQHTAEQGAKLIIDHMKDWRGKIKQG